MESKLQHADVTEKIIGAAFAVYSELGHGFLESVYQKAMQVELQQSGLKCEIECPIKVKYRNVIVGDFRADLFVNDVVIVELKTAKNYNAEDEPQLLNELKATGIKVGLLINLAGRKRNSKEWFFESVFLPCSIRG
jgi:GxxExxY protein